MFVHLHNHTHYSLLDAVPSPEQLISAAVADNQKALAITDHGVMFGCFEFYKKAKTAGIKPIIGVEAYVAVRNHTDRERFESHNKHRNYYHLVLLAKNETGYRNLIKLTSIAHEKGFYYKPRIDMNLLRQYHDGIVSTSACLAGPVNAPLLAGDYQAAVNNARELKEIFGDDFYIELQDHGLPEDKIVLEQAPKIARQLGIKIVVSNDTHYVQKKHAVSHNVLLHITKDVQYTKNQDFDIKRDLRYKVPEMYLKSQDEMKELFKAFPDGIENTAEIAEKVDLTIPTDLQMPQFPIPPESGVATLEDYLELRTMEGLERRYPLLTGEILDRAHFELSVIRKMGYAGYFLIVEDFIRAARNMGVRVGPGRGSAAGSIVAYALQITDIDPLKYDLLFERFLNPDRISMPDIDVDFADDKRDKVIEYVKTTYGSDSVAQIITFGTLSARAVLKDVGRVLGIDLATINSITDKIPVIQGKVTPLKEALDLPDLKWLKNSTEQRYKDLLEYSLDLEGTLRNSSLHAAGVVIAPGPVSNYVPVYQTPQTEPATQYNMKDLEAAGLLKMDFLGLRTLSIIENTLAQIKKSTGTTIDLDAIPFDDPDVFAMFGRGQTTAVFQFESEPMQQAMRNLQPSTIEDLIALNALYRPGPMDNIPEFIDRKHGKRAITYPHQLMEPILERTYGIIVYQEQVMQLVQTLAGFSLAQADLMRRAMGKKDPKLMAEQRELFVQGAGTHNNIDAVLAGSIFDLIQKFASYGFNKSHSAAYAYLAYQTAWLKTHYPTEFLAANMTAELGNQEKIVSFIDEARRYGITVLPPDINKSEATFIADGKIIYFGMAAIKNVGIPAVDSIVATRTDGPFTSIFDFAARIDSKVANKRVIEALVCSGAFDSIQSGNRAQLVGAIEAAVEYAHKVNSGGLNQMDSLFGSLENVALVEPSLPQAEPWPEQERYRREREYLNFYVSGHPLQPHAVAVHSYSSITVSNPDLTKNGKQVLLCGLVVDVKTRLNKREQTFAVVKVEQFTGSAEVLLWAETYTKYASVVQPDSVLVFSGKLEILGSAVRIIVDQVYTLQDALASLSSGYVIRVDPQTVDRGQLQKLRSYCDSHDGMKSLKFVVPRTSKTIQYNSLIKIKQTPETTEYLCSLFGQNNVRYDVESRKN
ncbi:MAG: DNA polymerase III subunit alpha [Chlorobi bacterium]|nr:MAG: DNA polymerase III subunit alpha [Bacteroidota bacterium]KXK35375.1 MAG: DNA polymerase III, alpha subunit [Chlorobi bacterium OLB6]MBE2265553.1 DNA polymerase III subunit alpha [Flavobacteriales bacterium]MBL1160721.1 DNA polymerase III subunit alpha [Chlorobiota bacterium]MBW7853072.1 DNA polymerase III subunit alpha [Candidatus Kapabacteria bacterium]MCC6331439.1 DNA polymerase III subunit alpha [Ignavibacteria bacterium]